jgi:uncharacterized protein
MKMTLALLERDPMFDSPEVQEDGEGGSCLHRASCKRGAILQENASPILKHGSQGSLTMEVRSSRASAVVVQRVPAAKTAWFLEWQRWIAGAAEEFPGFSRIDIYPPAADQHVEWIVVIQFADETSLQGWLDSSVRARWVEKLREQCEDFELKALPGGFGPWFTRLHDSPQELPPPEWKMALTVLLGLYPTVMLLTLFPGPYTEPLGLAFAMLIGNFLSVCILQWAVMPTLIALIAPWLKADPDTQKALSISGVIGILTVIGGMALLFHQITG